MGCGIERFHCSLYTNTLSFHSFNESEEIGLTVVSVRPAPGPVNTTDNVLHTHGGVADREVYILVDDRKNEPPVSVSCVQLIDAVARGEVLVSDDGNNGLTLVEASANGPMPVATRLYLLQLYGHWECLI